MDARAAFDAARADFVRVHDSYESFSSKYASSDTPTKFSSQPEVASTLNQECDFVMELKIPRYVVEKVYPNLAFNSSAISA